MTDAPTESPVENQPEQIASFVESWKAELTGQVSESASAVQDRLLDLWGRMGEGDARARVETWLTETLERQLYQVDDIERRLDELLPEVSPAG